MNASRFAATVGVVFVGLALSYFAWAAEPAPHEQTIKAGEYTLTGPYTHENLTIYLLHAPDKLKGKRYLTLQEALDQKLAVVHETGEVNELRIENLSPNMDLYIQSGDIVKGGRQDRTIAVDFICPPRSGQVAINAFCVEHGRWTRRGVESPALFGSSNNAIAGKELKLAARARRNQGEVWQQVAANQAKLSTNAGEAVADARSASSLQLSLENPKVREMTDAYQKELLHIAEGQNDVVGYAMAVNGKPNSADVYASHDLFVKLWPKLLDSAAVEAFAELPRDKKFELAKIDAMKSAIEDAEAGKGAPRDVTPRVQVVTKETKTNVLFETRDRQSTSPWLHRNYITKDEHTAGPRPTERLRLDQNPRPAPNGAAVNQAPVQQNQPEPR